MGNALQLPASVSPLLRIPLFWLSFHNFPLALYQRLVKKSYQKDGYVNLFFHPGEFVDLSNKDKFGLPAFVRKNSEKALQTRMDFFMAWLNKQGYPNAPIHQFMEAS